MKEIAIFGGTFDPPTLAHEAIVAAIMNQHAIDEVWMLPSGTRSDKPYMTDDDTRLAMLSLVRQTRFDGSTQLRVAEDELKLPRPTKTHATVEALKNSYSHARFWFVFGADSYHSMHTWERGYELKHSLGMLIIPRAGFMVPLQRDNIMHLEVPEAVPLNLSSTAVRMAISDGRPYEDMVSPEIAAFIESNRLYARAS